MSQKAPVSLCSGAARRTIWKRLTLISPKIPTKTAITQTNVADRNIFNSFSLETHTAPNRTLLGGNATITAPPTIGRSRMRSQCESSEKLTVSLSDSKRSTKRVVHGNLGDLMAYDVDTGRRSISPRLVWLRSRIDDNLIRIWLALLLSFCPPIIGN